MKIVKSYFFTIILIVAQINQAEGRIPDPYSVQPDLWREKLLIISDRDIYISGEKVFLQIFKLDGLTSTPSDISKIIYLELLNDQNNPVNQIKIKADGLSGSAALTLSDTLSSGNYILWAYTSWMKNFPENFFAFRMISVINPFNDPGKIASEVKEQTEEITNLSPAGEKTLYTDNDGFEIKIIPDKQEYHPREKVRLDILYTCPDGKASDANLALSVVKSFLSADHPVLNPGDKEENNVYSSSGIELYLPEPEGELLRGVIYNKATNQPLRATDISLSLIGKQARCQFMKTNEKGEFIFVLKDFCGTEEIVIQPLEPDQAGSYVELYQPFCDTYNRYRSPELRIDSISAVRINNAAIAMQVTRNYENEIVRVDDPEGKTTVSFFGEPVRIVKTEDYIELSDIREVVREILPEVVLFRKDRQPALKVISSNPYQIFSNPALVLLDGVPVTDIDKLLSISARELESVEIINSRYFYADYVFEGIISFISKKGNLSSLEENNSFFRQVFEGCLERKEFYSPVYDSDSARLSRIPDFRNTLFWKPDVSVTDSNPAEIEFYTSDEAADYIIVAEGFTSEGKRIRSTLPLIVK